MKANELTVKQFDEILDRLSAVEYDGEIFYVAYTVPSNEIPLLKWHTLDKVAIVGLYVGEDEGAYIKEVNYNDLKKDKSKLFEIKEITEI